MRVCISDLLFPGAPESLVQPLVARGGRGILFAPSAREESDPQWDGNYEFVDSESVLHHLHRIEPALLRRYEEAYRRHFTLWKACAQKYGLALARVDSARDLGTALRAEAVAAGAVEVGGEKCAPRIVAELLDEGLRSPVHRNPARLGIRLHAKDKSNGFCKAEEQATLSTSNPISSGASCDRSRRLL